MEWELKTEGGNTELTAFEVLNELMRGMMKEQKLDHEELATTFVKYLQMHEQLHLRTPQHLVLMAFTLGYYYHVFLKSNNVTVVGESNESSIDERNPTPTS